MGTSLMIAQCIPRFRWGSVAVAVLAAGLWYRWLIAPPPLTTAEQALVGTWVQQSAEDPAVTSLGKSHLTFGPGHSATKADFVFGPDAPPQVYHFTWRLEPAAL